MIIKNLSKSEYKKMKKLNTNNDFNTEANLFLISSKEKWNKKYKLFKKFYVTHGSVFSNKISTINTLIDFKDTINSYVNELVMPEKFIAINSKVEGYMMDYIKGSNLSNLLYNSKINLKEKIYYLKQVGLVLNKIKALRNLEGIDDFFLGDLHEDNIIVDENGKIHIIDIDSCKIGGNIPSPSLYMSRLKIKKCFNDKYKFNNYCTHLINPNEDTDNYCFAMMLLNTLYQGNIANLSIDEFYNYLDYLNYIGINKNLIDIFSNLYTNKKNSNCVYFIDSIDDKAYRASKKVYQINKEKKF